MGSKIIKQAALILLMAFIASLLFLSSWQSVIAQRGKALGFDIFLRWEAARALWQGQSPYSPEVTAQSDIDIYGRPRYSNEVAFNFYDPAYAAVILLPITLIPLAWVGTVWSALGFAIWVTLLMSWGGQLKPPLKTWLWGLVLISGLLYRPAIMTILNGQYSLFLVGCAAIVWWLIVQKQDLPAGIILAVTTIKPSIFLFVPIVIMLWAFRWKRWSLILGFIGALAAVGIVTLVKIGWWVPDFLSSLSAYNQNLGQQIDFSWSLQDIVSPLGLLWIGQSTLLLVIGALRLYRTDEIPWFACIAALNFNLILTPHIIEYDLGILLISLLWLGAEYRKYRWGMAAWLVLIWLPWLSWMVVIGLGGTLLQWQDLVWQIFPNLVLAFTWMLLIKEKRKLQAHPI